MAIPAESEQSIHFAEFELDLRTRELGTNGRRSALQEQPFQILTALLECPGQLVTRDELTKRLWPSNTFVDFEHSLNKAVTRLREALADSADQPRFIETLPRRGYRFIGPVQDHIAKTVSPVQDSPKSSREPAGEDTRLLVEKQRGHRWKILVPAALLLAASVVGGGLYWRSRQAKKPTGIETIVLADFVNNTSDPDALKQASFACRKGGDHSISPRPATRGTTYVDQSRSRDTDSDGQIGHGLRRSCR